MDAHPQIRTIQGEPTFWAFDSEFMMSGRARHPEDVHTIQFSNGDITIVMENDSQLKEWLESHDYIKTLYGFGMLCDLGSVKEWLGDKSVEPIRHRGSQIVGWIKHRHFKARCFDIQPMCQTFGWRRLEQCGQIVGVPKLPKPSWLGMRKWETQEEYKEFIEYAKSDAVITSKTAELLASPPLSIDPSVYPTVASVASQRLIQMPKRLKRVNRTVILSPIEKLVAKNCYAGRSEGFRTGFIPNVYYNDVSSLYPVSIAVTKALTITGAQPCDPSEIVVSKDLNDMRFGWLEGTFESENDLWGLPLRAKNNVYLTGKIQGFYHSYDLASAKAKVLHITRAYKPTFTNDLTQHKKYVDLLLKRVEGKFDENKPIKSYVKGLLNCIYGKLGQSKPIISQKSNFFAYSTILSYSHFLMSWLFDKCPTELLAMDTDSIFSHSDMSATWANLTDGEYLIPLTMSVKGKGDLTFFRSKRYILKGDDETVYGMHGWVYFREDFLRLFDGTITELNTRKDIKNTLLTNVREAKKMAKGRWKTKPVTLDLSKLKELLTADPKRKRVSYDSYQLVMERKSIPSKSWNIEDLLNMKENPLEYP